MILRDGDDNGRMLEELELRLTSWEVAGECGLFFPAVGGSADGKHNRNKAGRNRPTNPNLAVFYLHPTK